MVSGYLRMPDGAEFLAAHDQGLLPIGATERAGRFQMPAEMARSFRLPLWNFLFELHNGRIFRGLIGSWYLLVVPVCSLLLVAITLTGVFDWCWVRLSGPSGRTSS